MPSGLFVRTALQYEYSLVRVVAGGGSALYRADRTLALGHSKFLRTRGYRREAEHLALSRAYIENSIITRDEKRLFSSRVIMLLVLLPVLGTGPRTTAVAVRLLLYVCYG